LAAEDLRGKILELGARILETPAGDRHRGRHSSQRDGCAGSVSCGLANMPTFASTSLPAGGCPELSATRHYVSQGFPYLTANGMHGCLVEVDIETGMIEVLRLWVAHDCGRVVNPLLVDEQIRAASRRASAVCSTNTANTPRAGSCRTGPWPTYLVPMAGELPDIGSRTLRASPHKLRSAPKASARRAPSVRGRPVERGERCPGPARSRHGAGKPFSPDRVLRALAAGARAAKSPALAATSGFVPVNA